MLADIDPMKGFYDRVVASGKEQQIQVLRNLPLLFFDQTFSKKYVVEQGYASQETADFLWPESESDDG